MILLLDTATPMCRLALIRGNNRYESEWEAKRELAHGLLGYLEKKLANNAATFTDLTGIGVLRGPGSFTGLRIGLTVLNTLAEALDVPIVGATGNAWQDEALARLQKGENDRIVLPLYSSDAHITRPRK